MDMAIDPPSPSPAATAAAALAAAAEEAASTTTTSNGSIIGPSPASATAPLLLQQTAQSSSMQARLAESLKLEHQFVRVPLEQLKRTIRNHHRFAEREMSSVLAEVSAAADDESILPDAAVAHLDSLVSRLHRLKRKLEDENQEEDSQVQRCRARLDHLAKAACTEDVSEWTSARMNRILVDYMLRMSYYETAEKLSASSNIEGLVDVDVFLDAKRVIDALRNKEVAPALEWCSENKSRLKKSKSKFEFLLRLQEFVELVKVDAFRDAIKYARKHLSPWGSTYMKELQHVVATLVFKSTTSCDVYKVLFQPKQWDSLVDQFKQEFYKLYGMTLEPLLNIYLQAGLLALKTPFCCAGNCPIRDPLSQEGFRKLAEPLPFSKQHHSKLICYITKELMDTDNPPLVLPNGYVYSTKALEEMAKNNNGKIVCPRTGFECKFSELVKAFIS